MQLQPDHINLTSLSTQARIWLLLLLVSLPPQLLPAPLMNLSSHKALPWTRASQTRPGFHWTTPQVSSHTCCVLLLSTVSKQESNYDSVRPRTGYKSRHEALSAQDVTRNSVLNLLNIEQVEEEDAELFLVMFSLYLKTRLIDILIAKLSFFPFQSTKCKSLAHQWAMLEQTVLHLVMNCIPSLDRDLLDSILASLRKYALHLLSVQCKHHSHSMFHCCRQILPPSASRCVLAPRHTWNSCLDPHSSPEMTRFLHNTPFLQSVK